MEEFFNEIENKIQHALTTEIKRILKETGEEKIYAAALVTDSDCITLFLAVNTYEYMQKRDREYIEILHLPEEQAKKIREGTSSVVKWIPDEWGYSDGKNSELTQISKLLFAKEESNPDEYAKHFDLLIEKVISAFNHVIESNIFGENSEEISFFISMSDDERTYEIENHSAKVLNSEKIYQEFLKRHEISL